MKAISKALGVIQLWEELFGYTMPASPHVDSSACKGMLLRAGAGRVKHLTTKQLWVQAVVETLPVEVRKIPRSANYADMLTHCLPDGDASAQLKRMHFTCVA